MPIYDPRSGGSPDILVTMSLMAKMPGSPDILVTMSLMAKMPNSKKEQNSVKYSSEFYETTRGP